MLHERTRWRCHSKLALTRRCALSNRLWQSTSALLIRTFPALSSTPRWRNKIFKRKINNTLQINYQRETKKCQSQQSDVGGRKFTSQWREFYKVWKLEKFCFLDISVRRHWKGKNLNLIDCKTNHTQKSINFIRSTYIHLHHSEKKFFILKKHVRILWHEGTIGRAGASINYVFVHDRKESFPESFLRKTSNWVWDKPKSNSKRESIYQRRLSIGRKQFLMEENGNQCQTGIEIINAEVCAR